MIKELIEKTRSFRRFQQDRTIDRKLLVEMINCARLAGSTANKQPWQYAIIDQPEDCSKIFPHIGWAGYLKDWKGPVEGERPVAYVLCILNKNWAMASIQNAYFDLGISSQNMLLFAAANNIYGCRIGAFSKKVIENPPVKLQDHQSLELIIALGYGAEKIVLEETDSDIRYWRDKNSVHHVPKRKMRDILINISPHRRDSV